MWCTLFVPTQIAFLLSYILLLRHSRNAKVRHMTQMNINDFQLQSCDLNEGCMDILDGCLKVLEEEKYLLLKMDSKITRE